jgi:L-asparaginase
MKPKIQILFCGGTMVMVPDMNGRLTSPSAENALEMLTNFEPRLQEIAEIDVKFIVNIDSSDMTPKLWDEIAKAVYSGHDLYDGFVIIHGTDTMAYTASALSFALQDLGKPVVFTGAQIPGHLMESDARRNFINAVRLATYNAAHVMVLFGDKIMLGVRASKVSHTRLNAFSSVNWPKLGQVGVKLQFFQDVRKKTGQRPKLFCGFENKVASISLIPGMSVEILMRMLDDGLKGVILSAFGTGNIPHVCLPFLQKARDKQIPIVVRSQCLEGITNMGVYETGQSALNYGAIEAYDMSREAVTAKLMWAIYRSKSLKEIQEIMHKNYAGEIHIGTAIS